MTEMMAGMPLQPLGSDGHRGTGKASAKVERELEEEVVPMAE
jgi:hypothetical protein